MGPTKELTQMEVVVLCVAESNETANDVDERYIPNRQHSGLQNHREQSAQVYIRIAEAFFPKYLFW
jgi:hypothetical protein